MIISISWTLRLYTPLPIVSIASSWSLELRSQLPRTPAHRISHIRTTSTVKRSYHTPVLFPSFHSSKSLVLSFACFSLSSFQAHARRTKFHHHHHISRNSGKHTSHLSRTRFFSRATMGANRNEKLGEPARSFSVAREHCLLAYCCC